MFTSSLVLVSMLLAEPASAKKSAGSDWDPAAAKVLDGKVRQMFKDFDVGNVGTFLDQMDTPAMAWDIGVDGNPINANSREETQKMLDSYAKWFKDEGVTVNTTINRSDCHATSNFGYCALEFDQAFTMNGATQVQKFRATIISRMVDGDWRWSQWHASFREPMPMPAETAATP